MIEEFLSNLDSNQKIEIAKLITVFAGGAVMDYSIRKTLESYVLDTVKVNAFGMVEGYVNYKNRLS